MKLPSIKILQKLCWLTQLGLTLVAPPLLCLWLAAGLRQWLGLGVWLTVLAILVGLAGTLCGGAGFFGYCRREAKDPGQEKPLSYNNHD